MYSHYGGRGITVCERWNVSFQAFLEDMGEKPNSKYSIDRIENNGGYWCGKCEECVRLNHPTNCRWATPSQQRDNTRRSHLLTFNGKTQSVTAWGIELNIKRWVIFKRLQSGWSTRDALTIPVEKEGEPKSRKFKRERGW